jgi:hypothetical protein
MGSRLQRARLAWRNIRLFLDDQAENGVDYDAEIDDIDWLIGLFETGKRRAKAARTAPALSPITPSQQLKHTKK